MSDRPPRRFAVTDIGSNAARLLVGVVDDSGDFLAETFIRLPLRLGAAVFAGDGAVPPDVMLRLRQAINGMRAFVDALSPVVAWRVVGTAALRAATNRDAVVADLRRHCGVSARALSGEEEAAIIGRFVAAQFPGADSALNIDVGGGSTDCALIQGGRIACAESFAVGTARVGGGEATERRRFANWARARRQTITCASGGSARVLAAPGGKISRRRLATWRKKLAAMAPTDIAKRHGLSPDRAANIVAAIDIYRLALAGNNDVIAPISGGLAEAVLRELAAEAD